MKKPASKKIISRKSSSPPSKEASFGAVHQQKRRKVVGEEEEKVDVQEEEKVDPSLGHAAGRDSAESKQGPDAVASTSDLAEKKSPMTKDLPLNEVSFDEALELAKECNSDTLQRALELLTPDKVSGRVLLSSILLVKGKRLSDCTLSGEPGGPTPLYK